MLERAFTKGLVEALLIIFFSTYNTSSGSKKRNQI